MAREKRSIPGNVPLMTTTLWDYPSQNYPGSRQGDTAYPGATPSYVILNLLERYTKPKDLVVDPMAGSGTTLDVARSLKRRALAYDIAPQREDIFRADARKLPLEDAKADFVFVDPPYSNHIRYSGLPDCIGELDARKNDDYYQAMTEAIAEMDRILCPDRYLALYISDSSKKGKEFIPLGFELFAILRRFFTPVDIIAVVRHNRSLKRGRWHEAASEGNFFLRGFNHLFIMKKERPSRRPAPASRKPARKKSSARRGKTGEDRRRSTASRKPTPRKPAPRKKSRS